MIVPFWLRDGTESTLWTSMTAIDTALTGDPWASRWMVYCAGGITSHMFDLSPASAEIRTLKDCYRLVGQECEDDPEGARATHSIPNSHGKVAAVTSEWGVQYSQFSHIPAFFGGFPLWRYSVLAHVCVHWVATLTGRKDCYLRRPYRASGRRNHVGPMRMDGSTGLSQWDCASRVTGRAESFPEQPTIRISAMQSGRSDVRQPYP